jgi:hypothetical protein
LEGFYKVEFQHLEDFFGKTFHDRSPQSGFFLQKGVPKLR